MTNVLFRAEDWFDYYTCYLNDRPLIRSLSSLDGVEVDSVSIRDGKVRANLDLEIDDRFVFEDNGKESRLVLSVSGSYYISYEIEKNLSSEDLAKAERSLKSALKSGKTEFKIQTTAIADKNPSVFIDGRPSVKTFRDEGVIDSDKVIELMRAVMEGDSIDLDEYSFIKDIVPTPKDERIEFICSIPEELLLKSRRSSDHSDYVEKFHLEDWMEYYDAKLDKDDFKALIDEEDCSKATSIRFDGSLISADLESSVSETICVDSFDDETDESTEYDVEICAEFSYSVEYNLSTADLEYYSKEFDEALNEALDREESTFEIRVPFIAGEAYDLRVYELEIYDDEADEEAVYEEVIKSIERDLSNPTDARHNGDFVQPPSDKMVRFVCTIPAE